GAAVDLRGTIEVIAHGELRTGTRLELCQSRERHHPTLVVAHVELANIFGTGAVIPFGLDVHLPLPAKAVEIVNKQSAHECLDGTVHIIDGHTLLDGLVTVNL